MKGSKYLVFMGSGFELVVLMAGAIFFGKHIDAAFNCKPFGLLGLVLLGILAWGYHLFVLFQRVTKDTSTGDGGPK